jgi:hypothetical protein
MDGEQRPVAARLDLTGDGECAAGHWSDRQCGHREEARQADGELAWL